MQEQRKMLTHYEETVKAQNAAFESYSINLKNNNQLLDEILEKVSQEMRRIDTLERGLVSIEKKSTHHGTTLPASQKNIEPRENTSAQYYAIDYLDFENHFRGPRATIMESQKQYLSYFEGCSKVVDLGCGRGEFLELLLSSGIPATGVDIYEDFVAYCNVLGLNTVLDDGLHYLHLIDRTDGIFVGQVVEHLTVEQILELCDLAYQKLETGRYLIIETPNPRTLGIFANAFFIDPSHVKPVHPLTMEYFLRKSGFRDITILYTENSKSGQIPHLNPDMENGNGDFDAAMQRVSDMLFGSQDYAVIARKG